MTESDPMNMSSEFKDAIETVEEYRTGNGFGTKGKVSASEADSMGPVVYMREIWTAALRRAAHKAVISTWSEHEYMADTMVTIEVPYDVINSMTYLWLDWFKARRYLQDVDLHIHYIRVIGGAFFPGNTNLAHRLKVHDASKYTYEEIFGYVLKWTHNIEGLEWDESLQHHLKHNDHHPQYFEDDSAMVPEEAFLESILDMLSWNFIKNRKSHLHETDTRWLYEVQEQYLTRYVEADRVKVREVLKQWQESDVIFDGTREQ